MDFKDKVVWITGASSGIGEFLTYALADLGALIVISARNKRELERVRNNCPDSNKIWVEPLDVSDFEKIPPLAKKILDQFGQIHYLINNDGISQRALIQDTSFEVDQKIMNVNFLGSVALTKAVLPSMIKSRIGHIIVMSSVLGKMGVPWRSSYSASKHALHGYFDSLRAEVFKHNIKVTLICPGYVHTNVTINALKGDGSKNNVMANSTAGGFTPAEFAQKVIRAISKEKKEVYIGRKEVLGVYINRFAPSLFARIARSMKLN